MTFARIWAPAFKCDPIRGLTYVRLRDRHKPVTSLRELVTKGRDARCATCGTIWPCEVGQMVP
jgi:hypothetical protein